MANVLALVTFKIYPSQMGGQKSIALFYQHLKKYVNVTMVASKDNEQEISKGFLKSLYNNRFIFMNLLLFSQLKKIVRERNINVIIAEHSYPAFIAFFLSKLTRIPFIIHSHNIEALRFKQMSRKWWSAYWHYEKWVHRKADLNFFICREDEDYAIEKFGLDREKCATITYGIEPPNQQKAFEKVTFLRSLGLQGDETIFYFNGTLNYKPNSDAIEAIIEKIIPILNRSISNYKIIITGNNLPQSLKLKIEATENILHFGFVADIEPFYKAANAFLNPVLNDSGVKTKVIEAIANDCTVVSTQSGSKGILKTVCGDKLHIAADNDWQHFAALINQVAAKSSNLTPKEFFDFYLWDNIAIKAAQNIHQLTSNALSQS